MIFDHLSKIEHAPNARFHNIPNDPEAAEEEEEDMDKRPTQRSRLWSGEDVRPSRQHKSYSLVICCRRGAIGIARSTMPEGQILASQLGIHISSLGANLLKLNRGMNEAAIFFKHIGNCSIQGDNAIAKLVRKTTKMSKRISGLTTGTSAMVSYGGRACDIVGFGLQRLHPEVQTGGSLTDEFIQTISTETVQRVEDVVAEWKETEALIIADVSEQVDSTKAKKIHDRFIELGGSALERNSPVLTEKVREIGDGSSVTKS